MPLVPYDGEVLPENNTRLVPYNPHSDGNSIGAVLTPQEEQAFQELESRSQQERPRLDEDGPISLGSVAPKFASGELDFISDDLKSREYFPGGGFFNELGDTTLRTTARVGDFAEDLAQAGVRGATNAGKNLLQTGAMVMEGLGSPFGVNEGLTDRISEDYSYTEKEDSGIVEDIFAKTVELLPGLAVGGAGGKMAMDSLMAGKTLNIAGRAVKALAIGAAADVTAAMTTQNPDDHKLLIGPEGLLFEGFEEDTLFKKKLNLAMDELILGGLGQTLLGTAYIVFTRGVVGPQIARTLRWLSGTDQKKHTAEELIRVLTNGNDSVDAYKEVVNTIRNLSQDEVIQLTKISEELSNIPKVKNTYQLFIDNLLKQADELPPGQERQNLLVRVVQFENAIRGHAGPALRANLSAPIDSARRGLQSVENTIGGGSSNISKRGSEIAFEVSDDMLSGAQKAVSDATLERNNLGRALEQEIRNNPTFGEYIGKLFDFQDIPMENTTEFTRKVMGTVEALVERKKELFRAVDEIGSVKGSLKPIEDFIADKKVSEVLPKGFAELLSETGGSISKLDELASFQLTDQIGALLKEGRNQAAQKLIELKKLMTVGQLDYLETIAGRGGKRRELFDALTEARRFYKEEIVPIKDNPILEKTFDALNGPDSIRKVPEARRAIATGVSDAVKPFAQGSPEYIRDVGDFVNKYSGQLGKEYSDDLQAIAMDNIAVSIRSLSDSEGILDPNLITRIADDIRKVSPLLGPEKTRELSELLTRVRDGGIIRAKELDALIDTTTQRLRQAENRVYGKLLNDFFAEHGVPLRNGLVGFERLFKTAGNENKLAEILEYIKTPEQMEIFQGAFAKVLRENSLEGGTKVLREFVDPDSSWGRYAKKLYGDDGYSILRDMMQDGLRVIELQEGRAVQVVDPNVLQKQGTVAVQSMLTWVFGVLNPTAARIRTITSSYMADASITDQYKEYLDVMLANPKEFLEMADLVIKGKDGALNDPFVKGMLRRLILKAGFRAGVESKYSDDEPDFTAEDDIASTTPPGLEE